MKHHALGTHAFDTHLWLTNRTSSLNDLEEDVSMVPVTDPVRLRYWQWPNVYDAMRFFGGISGPHKFLNDARNSSAIAMKMLEEHGSYLFHFGNTHIGKKEQMEVLFSEGKFFLELWRRNCVFSCDEPVIEP